MENPLLNKTTLPILEPNSCAFATRLKNLLNNTIAFSGKHENYCVCIVDAVNSSNLMAPLPKDKVSKYYSIFLNSMAMIAREFSGKVVKNVGDSLLYYFPETSDDSNKHAFADPLECSMAMIEAHDIINEKMRDEGLPAVNYRISADYGSVMTASCTTSSCEDIFGSTVNMCAKINSKAMPNTMVIGADLYEIVKSFDGYKFEPIAIHSSGFQFHYTIYSVVYRKAGKWFFSV